MNKISVGYQGISGAYSEMASEKFFNKNKKNINFIGYETFEQIFEAVSNSQLEYGVVPVENSLAGSIHKNFDLLGKHKLRIIGEVYLHINHQLLALPGTKLKDIKEVYSHWQALAQTENNIKKLLPQAKQVEYFDTAGSAEYVKKTNDKSKASVASKKAGEVYGLKSLNKNFEDDKNNYTRFVIINHQYFKLENKKEKYKTSIIFTGKNIAGFLYRTLECFAKRDINLTKIESRPVSKKPWQYYFYIDFEGKYNDKKVEEALVELQKITKELKILGSYIAGKISK